MLVELGCDVVFALEHAGDPGYDVDCVVPGGPALGADDDGAIDVGDRARVAHAEAGEAVRMHADNSPGIGGDDPLEELFCGEGAEQC